MMYFEWCILHSSYAAAKVHIINGQTYFFVFFFLKMLQILLSLQRISRIPFLKVPVY